METIVQPSIIISFRRALVQRCSAVSIKNLITLGGQHQGVYGLPKCGSLSNEICDYLRKLLNYAAYLRYLYYYEIKCGKMVECDFPDHFMKKNSYKHMPALASFFCTLENAR